MSCVQLSEAFAVTREQKQTFISIICDSFLGRDREYPQTNLKLSFGTTKMEVYAYKTFVSLFVTKFGKFTELILFI